MRLSILAVVVSLALGAGLLAGCDKDRAVTGAAPAGSGGSSSSDATTSASPSTPAPAPAPAGDAASGSSSTPYSDTEKKQQ